MTQYPLTLRDDTHTQIKQNIDSLYRQNKPSQIGTYGEPISNEELAKIVYCSQR